MARREPSPRASRAWQRQAIAIFLSSAVASAAHSTPGLTELSLDELLEVQIVYAASRYEQNPLDAPASVSIVTRDEIEAHGYRTLADILAAARGFYTTYDRNYQYAGVRGFGRPGDYNTRLLLLVDGHRYNDNIYGSGGLGGDFPLDVAAIERVEIVRGPSSSLYGTSALFGAVNVVTKSGNNADGLGISTSVGSFDTRTAELQYGKASDNGVELFASASILDSGGQRLYFREFDAPESNSGFAEKADDEAIASSFVSISYKDFSIQTSSSRREKGIPTASWETEFNDSRTRTFDDQDQLSASFERSVAKDLQLLARADYSRYEYRGEYVFDYGEEGDPYILINHDGAVGEWWGGEVQLTKRLAGGHVLVTGTELRDNIRQDQWNFDEEVYLDDRRSTRTWGAYAQGEFVLNRKLRLHGGLRYDDYQDTGSRLSPRLGLIYRPSESARLKLLAGSAFRAPNAYELHYHDGNSTTKAPGSLESEVIETLEIVWAQQIFGSWKVESSLYDFRLRNLVGLTTDTEDELLVFSNLDEAAVRGGEVELAGSLPGGVRSRFSYSFAAAKDLTTDETLSNAPRHLFKVLLDRRILDQRLRLGSQLNYMSARRALDGVRVDDNLVANLTLTSPLWNERARVILSLYNLFDESFGDPGSEEHVQRLIPQNGRSWQLKLAWRF